MTDACCRVPETGSAVCEQPALGLARPSITLGTCPICGERSKPVQGQTVKSLLAISLRAVRDAQYHAEINAGILAGQCACDLRNP